MADPKTNATEPSIEEILASIRDIISDESTDKKAAEPVARMQPAPMEALPDDDVLELDTPVEEKTEIQAPAADAMPDFSVSTTEVDFTDDIAALIEAPVAEPVIEPVAHMPVNLDDDSTSLLDTAARNAVAAQIARLTANVAVAKQGHGGMTLEDLVRDMLTPLLKDWLDNNLPPLIEKMVAREIARLIDRAS